MFKYQVAALGGTFDHFHKGHQALINHALKAASEVVIGITTNGMIDHKTNNQSIEPYDKRVQSVKEYLLSLQADHRATLIPLTDIYGSTVSNEAIDCLVVSPATLPGGEKINQTRQEKQMLPLPLEICVIENDINGIEISSSRIRNGEINREGFVYTSLLRHDIRLNDFQKQQVKNPWGGLYLNPTYEEIKNALPSHSLAVAVGDATSQFCLDGQLPIHSFVFDGQIEREPAPVALGEQLNGGKLLFCQNPAGFITSSLSNTLHQAITLHKNVKVEGEEDLAVSPAILLLPLGSVILYGQPGKGIVVVEVSEEIKEKVRNLLS